MARDSIERLREGVRRVGMAEPWLALGPFMGRVADAGADAMTRTQQQIRQSVTLAQLLDFLRGSKSRAKTKR